MTIEDVKRCAEALESIAASLAILAEAVNTVDEDNGPYIRVMEQGGS